MPKMMNRRCILLQSNIALLRMKAMLRTLTCEEQALLAEYETAFSFFSQKQNAGQECYG
jgi:hypothetical protein